MIKKLTVVFLAVIVAVSSLLSLSAEALSKPAAPKLTAVENGANGVKISWSSRKKVEGYNIYRKTGKKAFKKIATVNSATVSFTDKKAKSNKKYTYAVKAYNGKGMSAYSKGKSILRVGTPKVTLINDKAAIKISWKKISGATKYKVLWKKNSKKTYKTLYVGKKTSVLADNINSGAKYDFKVKAVIKKTSGAYCSAKSKMFLEQPTLHAEEYTDMLGITLEWDEVKSAEGYYIYRSIKNENSFKKIKTIKSTNSKRITYVDNTCESIRSYKYYVVAYNGSDKSAKSNIDSDVYGYFENDDVPLYLTISKGEVYKDIHQKLKEYGAETFFVWSSSDSKVVKVSSDSIITGVSKGTATLTARGSGSYKNRHVYIIVTVK